MAEGIPAAEAFVASIVEDAVSHAERIGYPVVLKLNSRSMTHKTDAGGVQLNLRDASSVRLAFESIRDRVTMQAGAGAFDGVTIQRMQPTLMKLFSGAASIRSSGPYCCLALEDSSSKFSKTARSHFLR